MPRATQLPKPDGSGTCPHCGVFAHFSDDRFLSDQWHTTAGEYSLELTQVLCPQCEQPTVVMSISKLSDAQRLGSSPESDAVLSERMVWPIGRSYDLPEELGHSIREDFLEAAAVLPISPKASAALSRRCLQAVLMDMGTTSYRLSTQVEEIGARLTPDLAKDLQYIKEVGDFSAHPQKDEATGEVLDVEPGEAEWNLYVLQELFAELYVRPARSRRMRKRLNKKVLAAGRRPIGDEADLPDAEPEIIGVAREASSSQRMEPNKERSRAQKPMLDDEFPAEEDLPF